MSLPRLTSIGVARPSKARSGGPHRNDKCRLHKIEFAFQPLMARGDLGVTRLLVQPALAAQFPLEMLDGIGDIDLVALKTGIDQRTIEQLAGRADEGMTMPILLIAGLFADRHEPGMRRPRAEYRLRGIGPERTCLAVPRRFAHLQQ